MEGPEEGATAEQIMIEIRHKDTGQILLTVEADNLETANLSRQRLSGADLSNQSISAGFLSASYLCGANLAGADLSGVDLTGADLTGANLEGANLEGATFFNSIAVNADFSDANLMYTTFSHTSLDGSDLTCAIFGLNSFAFCDDLHKTKGLDDINHVEPTSFDTYTIRSSIGHLSNKFLKGCGNADDVIRELRTRYGPFCSCFLSYARMDRDFADTLYGDLKEANVPCWKDEIDSRAGLNWRNQIDEEIRTKEKVLLGCSKTSLTRRYVVEEIITTIQIEQETGKNKLIPIDLDGYIFETDLDAIAAEKVASGEWSMNWVSTVRDHQVANFQEWGNPVIYRDRLDKLLRDLRRMEGPSLNG